MNMKENNRKIVLGNYAAARGAYEAGCRVVCAYPGTPSTEITEEAAKYSCINASWAPNEKVAYEVAYGASVAGARAMYCCKHVGLNVAADPLFTSAYTGINGGFVVVVADDPGMHSSQNEQDSRYYALSAHVPMLEPSDSQETLDFTKLAFEMSERFDTPVLLRMTTRISHSRSYIAEGEREDAGLLEYTKNIGKYVMMPAMARARHIEIEKRMEEISAFVEDSPVNSVELNDVSVGIITSGAVYQYVKTAAPDVSVFKLGTVFPLPIEKIRAFSRRVKRLIVLEELEPFIQDILTQNGIRCEGKSLTGVLGELSVERVEEILSDKAVEKPVMSEIPSRPPVLCPGCPHRGIFSILSKRKLTVFGDIGCYTLGAVKPLSAIDTTLCMGASIGMAVGYEKVRGFDRRTVAVIGDSTFVHSGITGLISAVYNGLNTKILILDNSTTGMTGHQNHPATGKDISDQVTNRLVLEDVAKACGAASVTVTDAYDMAAINRMLDRELSAPGVSVMIIRSVCVLIDKNRKPRKSRITADCKSCGACLKIACPQISRDGTMKIDAVNCRGCGICSGVCAFGAIKMDDN